MRRGNNIEFYKILYKYFLYKLNLSYKSNLRNGSVHLAELIFLDIFHLVLITIIKEVTTNTLIDSSGLGSRLCNWHFCDEIIIERLNSFDEHVDRYNLKHARASWNKFFHKVRR